MKPTFQALLLLGSMAGYLGGCSTDESGGGSTSQDFQLTSPAVVVAPGAEITYCYYFRTPNTAQVAIKQWTSHMTAGAADMTLFLTATDFQPPGTQTATNCGFAGGVSIPAWTYVAYTPDADMTFPTDDGTGKPVGQVIPTNQAGYLRLHYVNGGIDPISVHVELNANTYDANTDVTKADAFVTYNSNIDIPANGSKTEVMTCDVPAGVSFFSISTHSHKQSVDTFVKDAATILFHGTDFSNPGSLDVVTAPFITFASGQLTYQCDYVNPTSANITEGDSYLTNEQCMAIAYFFPSTGPVICLNSTVLPSPIALSSGFRVPGSRTP
jgi:hypothetical protein